MCMIRLYHALHESAWPDHVREVQASEMVMAGTHRAHVVEVVGNWSHCPLESVTSFFYSTVCLGY